jgi:PAS domain S-box-containing protein
MSKSTAKGASPKASGARGRKRTSETPPESGAYYRALVENMADAVIVSRGVVTWCNDKVEDIIGYTRDELIGQDASFFVSSGVDPVVLTREVRQRTAGQPHYRGTTRATRKDGATIDVEFTISRITDEDPPELLAIVRDITQLKELEHERARAAATAAITDAMVDGLILIDTSGKIVSVNPAFERLTGRGKDQLVGRQALDLVKELVTPEDSKKIEGILSSYRKGKSPAPTAITILTADGCEVPVALAASFVADAEGKPMALVLTLKDITDRKLAEEALQSSEEKFRSLIESALDGIVIINVDGSVRYKSPSMIEILGERPLGVDPFDFIHPDDLPGAAEGFAQLIPNHGGTTHTEVRAMHSDGTWRTLEILGKNMLDNPAVGGIVVNMRDVTDRSMAEKALREGQEYFRSLIEYSMEGITILNRDGTIRYESPSVERLLGFDPEELIGKDATEFVHPDDVQGILDAFEVSTRGKPQAVLIEARFLHNDGSWRVLEAIVNNLLEDPVIDGIVINYRDITERKWAEAELRLKENALENSINAVAMSDMAGMITYVNKACMKMWGNEGKQDIIGKPYWRLLNPGDAVQATEIATAMVERGFWEGEVGAPLPDGTEMYVQVAAGLIRDDQGNPIQTISSFVDITEKKKAVEELRKSEEKFRRFVEKMNDGYCVLQGFKVVFANARSAEMFGYTQEEVIGKLIHDLLPPHTVQELSDVHERRKRGEKVPTQYETTLTRKDGTNSPVEFSARLIDYQGEPAVSIVVRDVAERKHMEKALRESEAQFRTMFEEAAIGIALVDMSGIPIKINPALQRMFGYTKEELSSIALTEYIHPSDAQTEAGLFRAVGAGARDHYRVEKRFTRKDGRSIWGYQTISPVKDSEGNPRFAIAMIEDITERKQAEDERQRMEQQLQLTGRLAAVGELAAGVAHELNNPLAAVQAYAQFLTSRRNLDETIKSDLDTIYKEAQRASRITSNLLSFARRHMPEKSLISINDTIDRSLELHAYRLRVNNIEIETKLSPDLPMTMADFHQIQQVFVNLITNAEQAMTEARGQGKLIVRSRKVGDMIEATFTDDGPGISEDDLTRIFDPFFTTKDVGKGTGLGLSICYGIVQDHGGQLYATSGLGKGTTFVLRLPVVTEDRQDAERTGLAQVEGD